MQCVIVNGELGWMWREPVVACFKIFYQHIFGEADGNSEVPQSE